MSRHISKRDDPQERPLCGEERPQGDKEFCSGCVAVIRRQIQDKVNADQLWLNPLFYPDDAP